VDLYSTSSSEALPTLIAPLKRGSIEAFAWHSFQSINQSINLFKLSFKIMV